MTQRRDLLKSALLLPLLSTTAARSLAASQPAAPARKFDFAALKGDARALSTRPYQPPPPLAAPRLAQLDYDQYQSLRFRRDHALWGNEERGFRLEFFHMGRGFKEPVRMYEVADGEAREILYQSAMFDFGNSGVSPRSLPKDLGFAGFRILAATNFQSDIAAFLGAAYFRAVGSDTRQFGLSARGLAIDTANGVEEFPRFTSFWFERPVLNARSLVVYALMDSPSTTGAFRFDIHPGAPMTMDIDAAIYPRKTIDRFGVAPLTSMYQCGENDRRVAYDWRPEIHDSDGLSMHTGSGEWIWRPLANPNGLRVNSYMDKNPRGFGLLQRDRDFRNYQDDGVFYERRPSLWIEPRGDWGPGAVQLVEIPTIDETFDNIVAYWVPAEKPKQGDELLFSYRASWGTQMPVYSSLGEAQATRTGLGGVIGQKRLHYSWRFAVDFAGGELAALLADAKVEPVISASRGAVEITSARPLHDIKGYRAMFDIRPLDDSTEPVDLRMFLRLNGQPLTETWIYQWNPPTLQERKLALAQAGTYE
jgi:glucans biosynthesis protein